MQVCPDPINFLQDRPIAGFVGRALNTSCQIRASFLLLKDGKMQDLTPALVTKSGPAQLRQSYILYLILTLTIGSLGACAVTDPQEGSSINYRMPRADVDSAISLTLNDCEDTSKGIELDINATMDLAVKSGAQDKYFSIKGIDLASSRIKRDLKITLGESEVISAVNANASDRSPAIAVNVLKSAALVAAFVASPAIDLGVKCKQEVKDAIKRNDLITKEIKRLNHELAIAKPNFAKNAATIKNINKLAREIVDRRKNMLEVVLKNEIKIDRISIDKKTINQGVILDKSAFAKWLENPTQNVVAALFRLSFRADAVDTPIDKIRPVRGSWLPHRSCGFSMKVPDPVLVKVVVAFDVLRGSEPPSDLLEEWDGRKIGLLTIPAAQWKDPAEICLDAGFGESRSVGLSFDEFGRRTEFSWKSEATGEVTSGAVVGAVPDLVSLGTTIEGRSELAEQKAKIEKLETQQKLNKLQACHEIIEAGGFDCEDS